MIRSAWIKAVLVMFKKYILTNTIITQTPNLTTSNHNSKWIDYNARCAMKI